MYITEWGETDDKGRQHQEVEIHHNTNQLVLYCTDIKKFDEIKKKFFNNPEEFDET